MHRELLPLHLPPGFFLSCTDSGRLPGLSATAENGPDGLPACLGQLRRAPRAGGERDRRFYQSVSWNWLPQTLNGVCDLLPLSWKWTVTQFDDPPMYFGYELWFT